MCFRPHVLFVNFFVKTKDWGRGRRGGGLNRKGGGVINFLPLKRGGLLERGGAYLRGGLNRGFTVSMLYKMRY